MGRARRNLDACVVGLDLSLRGAAAVAIPLDWDFSWHRLASMTCGRELNSFAGERDRISRLREIAHDVAHFVSATKPRHVFVEDYAFSASSSSVTKLAELGGVVRVRLFEMNLVSYPVTASQARKLLLGRLPHKNAKDATHTALAGMGCFWPSGDMMDAFAVANFGRSELGLRALAGGAG